MSRVLVREGHRATTPPTRCGNWRSILCQVRTIRAIGCPLTCQFLPAAVSLAVWWHELTVAPEDRHSETTLPSQTTPPFASNISLGMEEMFFLSLAFNLPCKMR